SEYSLWPGSTREYSDDRSAHERRSCVTRRRLWRRRRYWLVASLARRCSTCTFPLDFNEWCGLLTIPIPTLRRGARRTSTDGLWSVVIRPGIRAPSNLATPLLTRAVEHGREPAPAAEP